AALVESSFSVIVRYPTSALAVSPAASQARPSSDRNWARRNVYRAAAAAASYAVAASLGRSAFSYAAPSRPYVCARKYLSALGADRWSTSIACWVWPCASRACEQDAGLLGPMGPGKVLHHLGQYAGGERVVLRVEREAPLGDLATGASLRRLRGQEVPREESQ